MADVDRKCVYHGQNKMQSRHEFKWQGNTRMTLNNCSVWEFVTETSTFMRDTRANKE